MAFVNEKPSEEDKVKSGIRDQEEQVYEGINDQRKSQSGR